MCIVLLRMFDNGEILLQDVRYVPKLKKNFLSISTFDGLSYSVKIEHNVMKISDGLNKRNNLYILNGYTIIAHPFVTSQTLHDKTKL
uniref:Retrovirus-related Pol polyprotein from transposon TNT 1-94-like beta-barrel domain-containing protein n=1 Tax=Cajanus cajan TaxID=3821 RepID=A0A151U519_CAJCA|nr:hypothetical protein KK1_007040 [Cajanus cajan]